MKTNSEQALEELRQVISEAPPSSAKVISNVADALRELIRRSPDAGTIALLLVAAEVTVQEEKKLVSP